MMSGKWTYRLWLTMGVFGAMGAIAEAAPPWGDLIGLKSMEADPNKSYAVAEDNGPWMVMACSFSGEGAEKQAHELVIELRKRYKLPAYIFQGHFNLGEAAGRGVNKYGGPINWQYAKFRDKPKDKSKTEIQEYAVLVGNFSSVEDAEAKDMLRKIKFTQPQCLEVKVKSGDESESKTFQTLTGWRAIQKGVYEAIGSEKKKKGPMGHAFITTNPLLPPEYFAPRNGIDPFIVELNKGVPYSLLDCPGKYTVQVATFKGQVVIKQDEIQAIESGKEKMKGELAEAAHKADDLTRALRMHGYEAYQLHERYASIVTVGSFNSVGTPRPDGRIEINPQIHQIIKIFGPDPEKTKEIQEEFKATGLNKSMLATPVKNFIGIPFDPQPIPVIVPKRPISSKINREE
jgi:hypothetical protein